MRDTLLSSGNWAIISGLSLLPLLSRLIGGLQKYSSLIILLLNIFPSFISWIDPSPSTKAILVLRSKWSVQWIVEVVGLRVIVVSLNDWVIYGIV